MGHGAIKVKRKVEHPRALWTIQELGEAWTGGTLAKEYPDQIHRRRSERDDEIRLERHVYPLLRTTRVRDVTVEECETVMRSPTLAKLATNTRRNVGLTLNRILTPAVYPLKIISANPFPKGLLPRAPKGASKALADHRPADDAKLMACAAVPLAYRLLWGFLAREHAAGPNGGRLEARRLEAARRGSRAHEAAAIMPAVAGPASGREWR